MTDDEKAQAEAASWRAWQAAWGNTESGAHAHGWENGYQTGAAEAARLGAALQQAAACLVAASVDLRRRGDRENLAYVMEVIDVIDAALAGEGD
jgi:hypothetical protein